MFLSFYKLLILLENLGEFILFQLYLLAELSCHNTYLLFKLFILKNSLLKSLF